MKKTIIVVTLIVLCCVLSFPALASANSAKRAFCGVSSNGAIVTTQNCPVQVNAERLTFNINSFPQFYSEQEDYNANVIAEYDFYNPEDYNANMQLVFPFGYKPEYIYDDYNDTNKYGIYVNDVEVERTVRATYSASHFNLSNDLPKILDTPALLKCYDQNAVVYVYNLSLSCNTTDSSNCFVDFTLDDSIVLVRTTSCPSFPTKQGARVLNMNFRNSLTVYSVGEPLNDSFFHAQFYVSKYDKKQWITEDVRGNCTVTSRSEITLNNLLCSFYNEELGISITDYYNAVVDYISNRNYAVTYNSLDIHQDLLFWYQYDITVPAKQTVTNKVIAPLYPDVNKYYTPPMYTYTYLLSPASSFASFSNLDITVHTDFYLISSRIYNDDRDSDISFTKTENGYSYHFNSLPFGDLQFQVCEFPEPEYDNGMGLLWILLLALAIPFLFIIVVIIVVVVAVVTQKRKTQKAAERVGNSQTITDEQRDKAIKSYFGYTDEDIKNIK